MDSKLKQIARDIAYDDFERRHGFGLYHAHPDTIEREIKDARKKVDKWVELLRPAFEEEFTTRKTE